MSRIIRRIAVAYGLSGRKEKVDMPNPTNKKYLCKVQNCPMESNVKDDIVFYNETMRKAFGNDYSVVNCGKVESEDGKVLFCEILINSDRTVRMSELPDNVKIVMEVADV